MYNVKARYETGKTNGGVAQLARASGSYPAGRRFKSHRRYHLSDRFYRLFYGPLVKWLRHRPFTAITGVRVPYGSPFIYNFIDFHRSFSNDVGLEPERARA